jgi:hypothetical protein
MKQVIFVLALLFIGAATTEMNAQGCCAKKSACTAACTGSKGGQNDGASAMAVHTVNLDKTNAPKKACAGASMKSATGSVNCDPSKCDPSQCDPAKCDPAKCKVLKGI